MDLETARKALSKGRTFSTKRVAFFGVVGLCVVAGIFLRSGLYFTQPEAEQNTPATSSSSTAAKPAVELPESVAQPKGERNAPAAATPSSGSPATATSAVEGVGAVQSLPPAQNAVPTEPKPAVNELKPAGEANEHAEPVLPGSNIILVARQAVEVRASPSSSAPTLYGFPAGRPFRVIGREGGFAHIQDLKSNASGWIDEAALAQPPIAPGSASAEPFSAHGQSAQKSSAVTPRAEAAPQPERRRPGLFGRGGLFGGIFGN